MTVETGISLEDLERFLIILMRITAFINIAPFFNMSSTPVRIKLGLSIFVAILVNIAMPLEIPAYHNAFDYAFLLVKESVAGLLIGFAAFLCSTVILFAGKMIDLEIGMSMATMLDQATKTQTSLTGGLYNYLLLLMLLITNMHHFLLKALTDSYLIIPMGGIQTAGLYDTVLGFISEYFMMGIRIVMPIFAVTLLLNVILALLAKVAPQMNMFAVGIQLKILVGLIVLFLLAGMLPAMSDFVYTNMREFVIEIIKGMM